MCVFSDKTLVLTASTAFKIASQDIEAETDSEESLEEKKIDEVKRSLRDVQTLSILSKSGLQFLCTRADISTRMYSHLIHCESFYLRG